MAFKLIICVAVVVAIAISCEGANVDMNRRYMPRSGNSWDNDQESAHMRDDEQHVDSDWLSHNHNHQMRKQQEPTWRRSPIHSSVLREGTPMGLVTSQEVRRGSPEISVAERIHHETNPESSGNGRWVHNQLRMRNRQNQGRNVHTSHENTDGVNQIYKN